MSRSPLACFHRSNLLTYVSVAASITAIGFAARGMIDVSGALIAAAVVLDTFDGKFAGLFHRTDAQRAIGAQLDSLSDAISFGVAPAMCMVVRWGAASAGPVWWAAVITFAACAISRLAFYNVTHDQADGFVGLPAPVAALVWATVLLLDPGVGIATVVFVVTAAAMVLPLSIPRPRGIAFVAFVCWPLTVIAAHLATS
jgi:CDP-diacylglycerol---serine O-phosphatidyltransferase